MWGSGSLFQTRSERSRAGDAGPSDVSANCCGKWQKQENVRLGAQLEGIGQSRRNRLCRTLASPKTTHPSGRWCRLLCEAGSRQVCFQFAASRNFRQAVGSLSQLFALTVQGRNVQRVEVSSLTVHGEWSKHQRSARSHICLLSPGCYRGEVRDACIADRDRIEGGRCYGSQTLRPSTCVSCLLCGLNVSKRRRLG